MYKKNVVHHNKKGLSPGMHKLFYGYPQTDFKVYTKKQKTQNSQYNIEIEKHKTKN